MRNTQFEDGNDLNKMLIFRSCLPWWIFFSVNWIWMKNQKYSMNILLHNLWKKSRVLHQKSLTFLWRFLMEKSDRRGKAREVLLTQGGSTSLWDGQCEVVKEQGICRFTDSKYSRHVAKGINWLETLTICYNPETESGVYKIRDFLSEKICELLATLKKSINFPRDSSRNYSFFCFLLLKATCRLFNRPSTSCIQLIFMQWFMQHFSHGSSSLQSDHKYFSFAYFFITFAQIKQFTSYFL